MRFSDFIGNKHIVSVMQSALKTGRLSSAYLFSGREGVGKFLIALTVAQALHCKNLGTHHLIPDDQQSLGNIFGTRLSDVSPNFLEPCGTCTGCIKVEHRGHPDLFLVVPDGKQIKIEQIRDLQARLQYQPLESTRKVVIIDDANSMNVSAANALLRTLEEPPRGTVFFLIATSGDKLLPTVRSRCRHLRFSPLSKEEIEGWLKTHLQDNKDQDMALIAQMAEGSLSYAIQLAEEDIKELRDDLIEALINLNRMPAAQIFQLTSKYGKDVEDQQLVIRVLKSWYYDLYLYNTLQNDRFVINKDYSNEIAGQAARFSTDNLWNILREIEAVESSMAYNANLKIGLDRVLIGIGGHMT